jgi:hypothetical protein
MLGAANGLALSRDALSVICAATAASAASAALRKPVFCTLFLPETIGILSSLMQQRHDVTTLWEMKTR